MTRSLFELTYSKDLSSREMKKISSMLAASRLRSFSRYALSLYLSHSSLRVWRISKMMLIPISSVAMMEKVLSLSISAKIALPRCSAASPKLPSSLSTFSKCGRTSRA